MSSNKKFIPLSECYNTVLRKTQKEHKTVNQAVKAVRTLSESYQQVIGERYNVLYKKESDPQFSKVDVSDKQFNQAYKYFLISDEEELTTTEKIKASGLTEAQAKEVINIVLRYRDPNLFVNALNNKMSVDEFLKLTNIVEGVATRFKLDPSLVQNLLMFEPATKPSTGKGEVFMFLFVEGAKKGATGDVDVNGSLYEIKGSGARIKGQKGFGSFTAVARSFTNSLQSLISKSGIQITITNPNYNISANSNGFIDEVADDLIKTGKVTRTDILNTYVNGFKELYENANINDLIKWVGEGLDPNGRMNQKFKENYFKFALKYYADQEDFEYVLCIGTSPNPKYLFGKMSVLSKSDIISGTITGKVAIDSWPSFLPSAGQSGGVFAIRPTAAPTEKPTAVPVAAV
ncbi:MAG: hypothetical protein EB127_03815 [Alphaproteobacteria bacterium]|nr:hypothetical protein [Alphaproteobacteria bacterium]